jgi:hypothetical protein
VSWHRAETWLALAPLLRRLLLQPDPVKRLSFARLAPLLMQVASICLHSVRCSLFDELYSLVET